MLVHHFLENSACRLSDKVALIFNGKRLTYGEINASADRLAAALAKMGIARQDRVIVFMDNSPESVISIYGILKAGAIFVILNPQIKARKLNYILKDSGASALITHLSKAQIITDAVSDLEHLKCILWVGDKSFNIPESLPKTIEQHYWDQELSDSSTSKIDRIPPGIDLDLAAIIYTSGSIGYPKGVMSAHYNMVAAIRSITQYLENIEEDVILNILPLSFDYGLYQILMAFSVGATVVLEKSFDYPHPIIERLGEEKVTGFPIVPTIAAILLRMKNLGRFDFSCLRYISNTGARLPVAHIRKFQALFPHVKIYSMYGLTECKRVSYLPPDSIDKKPESVGIPMPNVEVFIVDEKGKELRQGMIGELVVRGSNVMQGYWNDPAGTASTFRPGRYRDEALLYTGDFFWRDEEGFLYFVGRKDDLIKTRGERVSPAEIENTLAGMEGIAEVAVIGVPDEVLGSALKAFVVTNDSDVTEQGVLRYCKENLEFYMVPKFVELKNSLPKLDTGKIDKKILAQ
jgi:long-chain acyl-CoA synthetase